jgi:hypothetical protein
MVQVLKENREREGKGQGGRGVESRVGSEERGMFFSYLFLSRFRGFLLLVFTSFPIFVLVCFGFFIFLTSKMNDVDTVAPSLCQRRNHDGAWGPTNGKKSIKKNYFLKRLIFFGSNMIDFFADQKKWR